MGIKKEAHKFLINKGHKSIAEKCSLYKIESYLVEFAEQQIKEKTDKFSYCLLEILDYLKLQDNSIDKNDDMLELNNETLSEMLFRKMEANGIDLNKELGFTHLKPIKK